VAKRRQHRSSGGADSRSSSKPSQRKAVSGNAARTGARESAREQKRAQFTGDSSPARSRRAIIVACAAIIAVLAVTGAFLLTRAGGSEFAQASVVQGKVRIPLAQVTDGKAHFYTYESGGTKVNYFVLASPDGTVRAAFDACDVCYPNKKGYHQSGDFMQCNNCGRRFRSDQVNVVEGGCNPSPLERKVVDGQLVITTTALEAGAHYFL